MTRKFRRRFYFWQGITYFDYLAELPPYAKILTESPMQTAEEIPSTYHANNITESKGENIPQLAERPPNTIAMQIGGELHSPLMQLVTSQKV